jgi:hypothetical protein
MGIRGKLRAAVLGWALGLGLLFLGTGCVSTEAFFQGADDKPVSSVCQVAVTFYPEVVHTPDPVHGGEPIPGLKGRIFLFVPDKTVPVVGDGSLVVDLYNTTGVPAGKPAPRVEQWILDRDTLKKFLRKDAVGWGYTLFLPWATYKPEITHVELRVCYVNAKGMPFYAPGTPVVLRPEAPAATPMTAAQAMKVPGS